MELKKWIEILLASQWMYLPINVSFSVYSTRYNRSANRQNANIVELANISTYMYR